MIWLAVCAGALVGYLWGHRDGWHLAFEVHRDDFIAAHHEALTRKNGT